MYGHQSAAGLPPEFPQFMARGAGARVWDVDGSEYVDLMCSYGPVVLGHRHRAVEAAAAAQAAKGDCQNAPSPRMVELAEALTATVAHADWAMFAKNGTDATTIALHDRPGARPGGAVILVASRRLPRRRSLVHAAARRRDRRGPREHGLLHLQRPGQRAARRRPRSGGDLAGIMVSHVPSTTSSHDQELADPEFARGLRALCDRTGAALILDDVRCGFRLHLGSSWEPVGVDPDLSAWSKAIANGHALAAVLGNDAFRDGARQLYVTGSFWFSAVPMAAAIATITALAEERAVEAMEQAGAALRAGILAQAHSWDLSVSYTGPAAMPYLSFAGDDDRQLADVFAAEALRGGAYLHPRHNWFVSAAMTGDDIARALEATDQGFAAVRKRIGN